MERLKRYLVDQDMTQEELARRVGVKQPTVWEWLNGDTLPSTSRLRTLARITGISMEELLSTDSNRRGSSSSAHLA